MSQELQQSAASAGEKVSALIVSGGTVAAGVMTRYEVVSFVTGTVASVVGSILACVLTYNHLKKGRLERKNLRLHNDILEGKKAEREGEKP